MSSLNELPEGLPSGRLICPAPLHLRKHVVFLGAPSKREPSPDPPPLEPVLWVSDETVSEPLSLWRRLIDLHEMTGLWPLLLQSLGRIDDDDERPWLAGELDPEPLWTVDNTDAEAVLTKLWPRFVHNETGEPHQRRYADFPGLTPAIHSTEQPSTWTDVPASTCLGPRRLGLVPATRGADALAFCGWIGPTNWVPHVRETVSVLRSFEERFGAVVVGVGFASLDLSVASPPATLDQALRIAAEHYAFCPDNFFPQNGRQPYEFDEYAQTLIGLRHWHFWWD